MRRMLAVALFLAASLARGQGSTTPAMAANDAAVAANAGAPANVVTISGTAPTDGQVPQWQASSSSWVAATVAGGGGLADPGGNGLVNRTALNTTSPYAGATCTNQVITALSAAGAGTCASVSAAMLASGAVDVSSATVTGTLAAGRFPALTGPVTTSAGSLATSVALTTTTDGGAIVKQATTPGTQQGSSGSANINVNGTVIQELDGQAATSTDGVILQNTTAATSGVPVQVSPNVELIGQAWNTGGTPATNTDVWRIQNQPVSANPTSQNLRFLSSINGGANTAPFVISSSGLGTFTSGVTMNGTLSNNGANGLYAIAGPVTGTGGYNLNYANSGVHLITGNRLVSTSCTSGTTCDTTTNIPANAQVLAVAYRVTTAVTGPTSIGFGTAANTTAFCSGITTFTVNTTGGCGGGSTGASGVSNGSAAALRITATGGSFTAGVIEFEITYILMTPPTS